MSDATLLLNAVAQGDAKAADKLLALVYDELRTLAAFKMSQQAPGQTLQPTALVHEAWLRLVGSQNPTFKDRRHFFCAAAEAMRHMKLFEQRVISPYVNGNPCMSFRRSHPGNEPCVQLFSVTRLNISW
jgi:RNA polymerase sigma factor (TIGR02999 family)